MKPVTGRMAVVVPHGVLFRGGSEAAIRRNLIESNLLDTVIGLPPKILYNTAIHAAILCFRAERADDPILFIDASRDCALGRRQNELRAQDIERIVATWRQRVAVPGYASVATREQVASNEFNLNISLYVRSAATEVRFNPDALARKQQELNIELAAIQQQIEARLHELIPEK